MSEDLPVCRKKETGIVKESDERGLNHRGRDTDLECLLRVKS